MAGDLRLRRNDELDQLAHRALALRQRLEDPEASRVAERAEVLGDDLDRERLPRTFARGYATDRAAGPVEPPDGMAAGVLLAHAGHPAEWLPFVAPLLLVALAWLVIRVRDAAVDDEREERARVDSQAAQPEDDGLADG
jgi:hypothetical protein